jgi:hypothetical protein
MVSSSTKDREYPYALGFFFCFFICMIYILYMYIYTYSYITARDREYPVNTLGFCLTYTIEHLLQREHLLYKRTPSIQENTFYTREEGFYMPCKTAGRQIHGARYLPYFFLVGAC